MFELEDLRKKIEQQDYVGALLIIGELEELSREDKLNKIYSYMVILLLHLIKQKAEQRSTSSWERSILNSIDGINLTNKRRKAGGHYADEDLLKEIATEAYPKALREASYEAFEGKLTVAQLEENIDPTAIVKDAIALLKN